MTKQFVQYWSSFVYNLIIYKRSNENEIIHWYLLTKLGFYNNIAIYSISPFVYNLFNKKRSNGNEIIQFIYSLSQKMMTKWFIWSLFVYSLIFNKRKSDRNEITLVIVN